MAVSLQYNGLTIDVFDDNTFSLSPDSPTKYDKVIQSDKDKQCSPISQHAIKVFKDTNLIANAIILASGGGTGVHNDSVLIDNDNLIIRCCNKVFSLALPSLVTNWVAEADWATCFSIHKYKDTYISHGETSIARIDQTGRVLWSYSGSDIFVCLYEGEPFEMRDDHIALTGFNGSKYTIDYNGKTIAYNESNYHKQKATEILLRPARKWWQFW